MSDFTTLVSDEQKLGVGEILICNRETKGKFEPVKYFFGKVILAIGGGGDKIFIVEEKDKYKSEVKSIQINPALQKKMYNFSTSNISNNVEEEELKKMEEEFTDMNNELNDAQNNNQNISPNEKNNESNEEKIKKETIEENNDKSDIKEKSNNNVDLDESSEREIPAHIVQICKGKYHLVKLTSDGKVHCSGKSYFGVSGLGGSASSEKTKPLPNLINQKIVQITCGEFHSMALSNTGDLYTWGMGFEGQLGLNNQYKVASSPRYLNFFYRKPIKFVCCGYNYSLAITRDDSLLYGWGENKLGQLGLGNTRQIIDQPTLINIIDQNGGQEGSILSEALVNNKSDRIYTQKPLKSFYVSAGYSHTCVVTEKGPVTFGLNIYGQLGTGNTNTSYEPKLIEKDEKGENIETIVKCACSTSGTFMISESGKLYTCGTGDIGHGDLGMVSLPKIVSGQRLYSHVYCNDTSVVAFGPLRILSVSPNCGPATGNTILSILGTAFKGMQKLSVRFLFGGISRDVRGNFDKLSRTIFVNTPNFLEFAPTMELPCDCTIQVTFDGHFFTEYPEKFLIYPNNIKANSIEPKCGPIGGNTPLQMKINLKGIPQKYLFSLTVGFQARNIPLDQNNKRFKAKSKSNSESIVEDSKAISDNQNPNQNTLQNINLKEGQIINPMDLENLESQLDQPNWICCFATYDLDNNLMTCNIPKIENYNPIQPEYNVDIAINGQQFSGYPSIYRFYNIYIDKMTPDICTPEGDLPLTIYGTDLFDSQNKKARIISEIGKKNVEIQWDKNSKTMVVQALPLNQITSDEKILNIEKMQDLYNNYIFDVMISMNGTQWLKAGSYRYYQPKISKLLYIIFKETDTLEIRQKQIEEPGPLNENEKILLGMAEPPTEKKALAEYEKVSKEEEDMIKNQHKSPYNGLALYGDYFPNIKDMKIKFWTGTGEDMSEIETELYYKNENKLACIVKELPDLNAGEYEVNMSISINGIQWTNVDHKILYLAPEDGLSFDDIIKLDAANDKNKKKKK
jgi:alpha-tubulin suppressor-like RCC1 family protein